MAYKSGCTALDSFIDRRPGVACRARGMAGMEGGREAFKQRYLRIAGGADVR
jgi:hypothetical protein